MIKDLNFAGQHLKTSWTTSADTLGLVAWTGHVVELDLDLKSLAWGQARGAIGLTLWFMFDLLPMSGISEKSQ